MPSPGPLQRWLSRWLGDADAPAEPATVDLGPGTRVGRYLIVDRLGEGGMGVVYQARDTSLDRTVALKFLPPHLTRDDEAARRLLVEARAAARIDHPNICTVHEIGTLEDGRSFIAMAHYEGRTLAATLAREGRLEMKRAAQVGVGLARGLERAHAAGIIHRDVKPANVFLPTDGPVKILDFGIAKLPGVDLTQSGTALGTIAYMSPEQIQGFDIDARVDLWALGVVLYEMCTGERPFIGTDHVVLMRQILELDPPPLADMLTGVPAELSDLVRQCLHKDRRERPTTAARLIGTLESIAGEGGGAEHPRGETPAPAPGLAAGGERRQATVLVAELAGRRELEESLSPRQVDEFISACRDAMDAEIERVGGIVNRNSGERVHGLFGIPVTREDDALRAIRAARALAARVAEIAEAAGVSGSVRLRCGLDSGRVVAREDTGGEVRFRVVGGPADRCLRIAPIARPGGLLISAACRRLVAPFVQTEPGPPLPGEEAGDPDVATFRVIDETGGRTRLKAATAGELTPLTGRDLELRTLIEALDSTCRGEGALVTITGETGVGKSRLLLEFKHQIDLARFDVATGRCLPSGGDVPYLPFIDVLRDCLRLDELEGREDAAAVADRVRDIAPDLEDFIPFYLQLLSLAEGGDSTVLEGLAGEQLRLALVESLATLPALRAQHRPGVMLLEDWHWVDGASRGVLQQLLEMASAVPLLVVVTTRPEGGDDWGSPGRHVPIVLGPMNQEGSGRIISSALRADDVPAALTRLLHERTGGNPFFLEEVCRALLESGAISVREGQAATGGSLDVLELPETVQGVIRTRLDRLDADTRRLVRHAAVIGREFGRDVLEYALGEGEDPGRGLERLRELGIIQQIRVVPRTVYRFKHALTQEVAYDSLLDRQRSEIHGQVGAAIEALHADRLDEHLDALAEHFARAGSWEKAVQHAMSAAERLWSFSEVVDAADTLGRAMEWASNLPAPEAFDRRVELLLRQERMHEYLGARDRQQEIIDELISMLDPERDTAQLATTRIRQADLCIVTGDQDRAESALESAIELCQAAGLNAIEGKALRSFGFLRWHQERHREAVELVERALAVEHALENVGSIIANLCNLGRLHRSLGEHDRALELFDQALELEQGARPEREHGMHHGTTEGYILHSIATVHAARGDSATALGYLERARNWLETRAGRHFDAMEMSYHLIAIARIKLEEGHLEEGLSLYRESADLTRRARHLEGLATSSRLLGETLLNLERYDEAHASLVEAAETYERIKKREAAAGMWRGVAVAREAVGRADARDAWAAAAVLADDTGNHALSVEAHEGRGRTLRVHDPAESLRAYETAFERASALDDAARLGRLRYKIGLLHWEAARYEEALRCFEEACERLEEAGNAPELGLAANSVGRTLRDLGRLDDARRRLEDALELHRRSGERLLESHALATLGDVLLDAGDPGAASERFTAALEIRTSLDDEAGRGWMMCRLAAAQRARGSADGVSYYLSEAEEIASRIEDEELERECASLRGDTTPTDREV